MASLWKRLVNGLTGTSSREELPSPSGAPTCDEGVPRSPFFDPALVPAPAMRPGDPVFAEAETAARWQKARRHVMDHILRLVSESPWKDNLVLRGSRLLKAWFATAAREPGDLDWVVTPATIQMSDPWSNKMLHGLLKLISQSSWPRDIDILVKDVTLEDIWTYDRAPGSRMVFPWRAPGLPLGAVQFDVVFGEELAAPPLQLSLPTVEGSAPLVWTVSKEQSLAWKILWLETDSYPQGKDLYDATLLAELTYLPFEVLERTLQTAAGAISRPRTADFVLKWDVDWSNFQREYPWVEGEAMEWQGRLFRALEPTFANRDHV